MSHNPDWVNIFIKSNLWRHSWGIFFENDDRHWFGGFCEFGATLTSHLLNKGRKREHLQKKFFCIISKINWLVPILQVFGHSPINL